MKKMSKYAAKAVGKLQKYHGPHFQHAGIEPQPDPNSQKKHRKHSPQLLFGLAFHHIQTELPIFEHFHRR